MFNALFMIFQGSVTLSLQKKDVNEYFKIYSTCYFGDYQMLMDLKATECYKSSDDSNCYTYCIKKDKFNELMETFPDAKILFTERAEARRIEFRRIKKQFETEYQVDRDEVDDAEKFEKMPHRYVTKFYAEDPEY